MPNKCAWRSLVKPQHLLATAPRLPSRAETLPRARIPGVLSRRRFLGAAAGATAAAGAGVAGIRTAEARGIGLAVPIATTVEFFPGVHSHVQGPPFLGGADADPSTVYDFRGASAIAFINGEVERRNRKTGEVRTLPYLFNDMRFMQGRFRGHDGHVRNGTFAFI
jgi:hypothetical protein